MFEGAELGKVTDIGLIGTDRRRLDSYTADFRQRQLTELFVGTPYQFKAFTKTNGYANAPLEALWLRAPYLHNGSVPTLADLLKPPTARPVAFVRGIDIIDAKNGGMLAPTCTPGKPPPDEFCFDTRSRVTAMAAMPMEPTSRRPPKPISGHLHILIAERRHDRLLTIG